MILATSSLVPTPSAPRLVASESTSTWKHRNPTTDLVQRITTIAIAQSNIFSLLLSPGPWEDDLHIQIVPGFRGKKVCAPDGLVPLGLQLQPRINNSYGSRSAVLRRPPLLSSFLVPRSSFLVPLLAEGTPCQLSSRSAGQASRSAVQGSSQLVSIQLRG
jgi:hypothetical protein